MNYLELEQKFPQLPWREPVRAQRKYKQMKEAYFCRFCLDANGMQEEGFATREECERHIAGDHPKLEWSDLDFVTYLRESESKEVLGFAELCGDGRWRSNRYEGSMPDREVAKAEILHRYKGKIHA